MKSATRLTSKGQVVIPKPVREQLRWVSGTELAVSVTGDGAVRLALLEAGDPIDLLYGCLKDLPGDPVADLEAEHQAEIEADERRQWPEHAPTSVRWRSRVAGLHLGVAATTPDFDDPLSEVISASGA